MNKKSKIARDTIILTATYLILQGLSFVLNIYITKAMGEKAVGVVQLISSFYFFILVLSNGNIFMCASRFVSEEIGRGGQHINRVMKYSLGFCVTLSLIFMSVIWFFAPTISEASLKDPKAVVALRLLALSLPLASIGSCLKGYFHAVRHIKKPALGDAIEFIARASILFGIIVLCKPTTNVGICTAIAVSIVAGEVFSSIYLSISYYNHSRNYIASVYEISLSEKTKEINTFFKYLFAISPIVLNGYISVMLSSANETLVPLTLKQFSQSTDEALSLYGVFEAIVIPMLFVPSVLLQCLSNILVPEIAREKAAKNEYKVKRLTDKVIKTTFAWAILYAGILFFYGEKICSLICEHSIAGKSLKLLCFVIPFIYLEISLEGIIKGLGKQNFSTANYTLEYIIRIACVVIFVPKIGFYGIVISYLASNVTCNIIRLIVLFNIVKIKFATFNYILKPIISVLVGSRFSTFIIYLIGFDNRYAVAEIILYIVLTAIIYIIVYKILDNLYNILQKNEQLVLKDNKT